MDSDTVSDNDVDGDGPGPMNSDDDEIFVDCEPMSSTNLDADDRSSRMPSTR